MIIEVLKSKIHRAKITQAELHYVGSITIDEDLMDAANIIENEKVQIVNVNNGERLDTYVIKGKRGSGDVCLNGPAARKAQVGELLNYLLPLRFKGSTTEINQIHNAFNITCSLIFGAWS